MNIRARFKDINIGTDLKPELVFGVEKISESLEKLKDKIVVMGIEEYKGQRSLDANARYWATIGELKDILGMSKTELHLRLLKDYGVGSYISVIKEAAGQFERTVKYYEKLGEIEKVVDGEKQIWVKYLILKGSSEMNTAEFSRLIKGLVSECEAQGIRTLETEELERMIEEMSRKRN